MTDTSGNVVARYDYDPYGRVTKVSGSVDSDFLYTGHYYHAPSGLHLALYRAYDAESGRWLNRDPIGEEGGQNLYGYVENNPLNLIDKNGLWPTAIHDTIIDKAFPTLSQSDRQILKDASKWADRAAGQLSGASHTHAMRGSKESVDEAKAKWKAYIADQLKMAREAQDKWCKDGKTGYSPDALWHMGLALHAVSDSTSPEHKGFQVWNPLDPVGVAAHWFGEGFISESEMDESTKLLNRYFQLPFVRNVKSSPPPKKKK